MIVFKIRVFFLGNPQDDKTGPFSKKIKLAGLKLPQGLKVNYKKRKRASKVYNGDLLVATKSMT